MAVFDIDAFGNLTFNLPAGDGVKVEISVPPLDCVAPADIEAVNDKIEQVEHITPVESVRIMLAHYATTEAQKNAIEALVARQLLQIDAIWTKESGITLGESEPSTDTSSQKTQSD